MTRLADALALPLVLALALPTVAAASDRAQEVVVWLKGPFGAVVGTDIEEPATAAPDARALDTWMRRATLELAVDPPLEQGATVSLRSIALDGGQVVELPLDDDRWVTAPDRPGLHTVVATVRQDGREPSEHAWLLEVPDRPGSWETLLEMPPLEASLSTANGSVVGVRGHGCYVDSCQEVGYRPPAASLAPLAVSVGEPLTLGLADGSALVHWEGRLEPQTGTRSETRLAEADFDGPVIGPTLVGLEPDQPGEWLLELRVDYDRERGWQWYLFRLIAD